MKKSISTLDYVVNISARKLQYREHIKNTIPEFKKHQEAIEDTIANMDNSVFLTRGEVKNKKVQETITDELDGRKIEANFKDTFEKRHPELHLDSLMLFHWNQYKRGG